MFEWSHGTRELPFQCYRGGCHCCYGFCDVDAVNPWNCTSTQLCNSTAAHQNYFSFVFLFLWAQEKPKPTNCNQWNYNKITLLIPILWLQFFHILQEEDVKQYSTKINIFTCCTSSLIQFPFFCSLQSINILTARRMLAIFYILLESDQIEFFIVALRQISVCYVFPNRNNGIINGSFKSILDLPVIH